MATRIELEKPKMAGGAIRARYFQSLGKGLHLFDSVFNGITYIHVREVLNDEDSYQRRDLPDAAKVQRTVFYSTSARYRRETNGDRARHLLQPPYWGKLVRLRQLRLSKREHQEILATGRRNGRPPDEERRVPDVRPIQRIEERT